jgi:hypothetical protein
MVDSKLLHIRAQADTLGVKYHHNSKVATIAKAIDAHLVGDSTIKPPTPLVESAARPTDVNPNADSKFLKRPVVP